MTIPLLAWGESGRILAVLPSLFTVGPLALLAWLFPAIFGGLALSLRRAIVLCTVLASISTVYLVQASLRRSLAGTWLATPSAFWLTASGIAAVGLLWTCVRASRVSASVPVRPGYGAVLVLGIMSLLGLWVALECLLPDSARGWRDLLPLCVVVWTGFVSVLWSRRRSDSDRPANIVTPERAMLIALTLACGWSFLASAPARASASMEIVWAFEPVERGAIVSTPLAAGPHVFIGTIRDGADRSRGAVYALDQTTGKPVWRFDDGGRMLNMFSTPCLADGRLFIGEGMHADFACKLYCLDAATGRKLWDFPASNHIESSPTVAGGKVFVGAGDDGLFCLDAATGKQLWHFDDGLHIDASPAVAGDCVYVSSGVSRRRRTTEILCLHAGTGQVQWRKPTDLPAWGSPLVVGNRIYFGLGNGRLTTSAPPPEKPAGALLCVDAHTGETIFRFAAGDAVLARAATDGERVYFSSRDGNGYALNAADGRLAWKAALGSPAVTTPALSGKHVYFVPSEGSVFCLDAGTGIVVASFDLRKWNGTDVRLLSSPVMAAAEPGLEAAGEIVYLGAEVRGPLGSAAILYALRGPP